MESVRREATCYWLARNDPDFAGLGELLPRYYGYDAGNDLLVVELLAEAENLTERFRRLGAFDTDAAAELGRALAAYQFRTGSSMRLGRGASPFPRMVPWILSLHHFDLTAMGSLNAGRVQLVQAITANRELGATLDAVAARWRQDSLIHGDLKWDNCLVLDGAAEGELRIVDWELADFGDACWDVGAILQSFLSYALLTAPLTSLPPPGRAGEVAAGALAQFVPAMQAFWRAWVERLQLQPAGRAEILERCFVYGAARLVQSAYESLYQAQQVSLHALALLQLSLETMKSPGPLLARTGLES